MTDKSTKSNKNTECAADYNSTRPCCNNPGEPGSVPPENVCPISYPKCANYIANKSWGTCINPNDNSVRTTTVDLETLKLQYHQTLKLYTKIQQEYISVLGERDTITLPKFTYLANDQLMTFDGSLNMCEAACTFKKKCKGATFDSTSNSCTLYSDKGQTMASDSSGNYAILPKLDYLSDKLTRLNDKLTQINNSMLDLITSKGESQFDNIFSSKKKSIIEMKKSQKMLDVERKKLKQLQKAIVEINEGKKMEDLEINKNYYSYILLSSIAIFCIIGIVAVSNLKTSDTKSG